MENIRYTINKSDVISSFRNWAIMNAVMLLAYYNQLRDMFVLWKFDWCSIREMIVISGFSLIAFFIKRFIMGKKQ